MPGDRYRNHHRIHRSHVQRATGAVQFKSVPKRRRMFYRRRLLRVLLRPRLPRRPLPIPIRRMCTATIAKVRKHNGPTYNKKRLFRLRSPETVAVVPVAIIPEYYYTRYRMKHHLADPGWVYYHLGFSTVCPILLGQMRVWQSWQDRSNMQIKASL